MLTTVDWSIESFAKTLPKDPDKLLMLKLPADMQQRAEELLELRKSDRLDDETRSEIKRMLQLESHIWKLKAAVLEAKARRK